MTRRTTLARQLWLRTTLIVAVLAVALSVATVLLARSLAVGQVDTHLDAAFHRQQRVAGTPRPGEVPGITEPGMALGTIVVLQTRDGAVFGSVVVEGGYEPLAQDAADVLFATDPDSGKHSRRVPGMGDYRLEVRTTPEVIVGVGLPLGDTHETLSRLALFAAALTVVAVLVAAVATRTVTSRATAPLRRLSSAAAHLSTADLSGGEVSMPQPVDVDALPSGHEVTQLAGAFNLMLENVQSSLEARNHSETKLRRFVADASHELRNPLAAIRGYAELADRANDEDREYALGRINAEATRMTKLVSDLLLLARLDAEAPTRLQSVDVVEVALNAVNDARAAGPEQTWRLELPEEGFEVLADPDQLHQVVVNLLSNARTHTPPGTTVSTIVGIRAGWGCLMVVDDGPGIPPEMLPHVFERFARADGARPHRQQPSAGLGLAIVDAATRSFGGHATVESVPGRTAFTVWVPLAPPAEPADE